VGLHSQENSALVLTTNKAIVIFNSTINQDFVQKDDPFDCSAYLYAYTQSSAVYESNTPASLSFPSSAAGLTISASTIYHHFQPSVGPVVCTGASCSAGIYHNCPQNLNSENYFDIVELNVQNIGVFAYYLDCSQAFSPFFFQWGQLLITLIATVTIALATVYARLDAFGGSGITYGVRWIIVMACLILFVGLLTLFATNIAAPLLDAVCGVVGIVCVGLVTL
jgi:hypothetical protein